MTIRPLTQYLELMRASGVEDIFLKQDDEMEKQEEIETKFEMKPADKEKILFELKKRYSECKKCPLWQGRIKLVYGQGDANAKMMLIGEGPGERENITGEAFVGKAGQLLTKMLQAIDLDREEVYIGNIVKCRPPNNRDPLEEERQACLPYLIEQIEIIRPQILLLLGKVAGNTMLKNNMSLGAMREQESSFMGIPTYVSYHPSALLRNPQWKRPAWEDLQKVRDHYRKLPSKA